MIDKEWVIFLWGFMVASTLQKTRPHRDVLTTQGVVRGYFLQDPPHYAFLGIPYARPPTLQDRFKAPEPLVYWDGIFEAIHRVKCPQIDEEGVENCLVINVFMPVHVTTMPVVVHVHDGDFQRGWGSHRAPPRLLKENFTIITFNYRLGVLGFLCLWCADAPGNAGLKDQVAALYWVQRNIKNFGGDPADITIYGTGSGAVAVELLLLSGTTAGLFHRIILESGSALAPSSVTYTPISTALRVAVLLGYDGDAGTGNLAEFFQDIPVKRLQNLTEMFLPCIEREQSVVVSSLLELDPMDILKDGNFIHVPIMIAYTNALEVGIISNNLHRFTFLPEDFKIMLPNNLEFDNEDLRMKLAKLVKEFYFGESVEGDNLISNYVDYVNDIFVEYPVIKSAILHARATQPVYLMKFSYKSSSSSVTNEDISGAGHGDFYLYVFSEQLQGDDELIAERLVQLISHFIKLGDPTPLTTTLIPVIWEQVPSTEDYEGKITDVPYLLFDKVVVNQLVSGQQLIFWDHIYSKFYKKHGYSLK